jgi:fatty acid desaturase
MITKIHGLTYDLTHFKHPGGIIPMHLIDHQDGTILFESYHSVSDKKHLMTILAKYTITSKVSIETEYEFPEYTNDFTQELRTEVYNYFKALALGKKCSIIEATKMSHSKIMENVLLFTLFLGSLTYYDGSMLSLGITAFLHFLCLINNWHDASHFALTSNKTLEAILMPLCMALYPTFSWYTEHTRKHHSFTNISGLDQTMDRYKMDGRTMTTLPFTLLLKLFFSNNAEDIYTVEFRKIYIIQLGLHMAVKCLFAYCIYLWSTYSFETIVLHYLILLVLFASGTKINHTHRENRTSHKNYYIHQILTSSNVCSSSYFMRVLTGGLNCQIEHHLFPSINSCHLPELAKIVRKCCLKYNIRYNEYDSFYTALKDSLAP